MWEVEKSWKDGNLKYQTEDLLKLDVKKLKIYTLCSIQCQLGIKTQFVVL